MAFFIFALSIITLLSTTATAADTNSTCYALDGARLNETYTPCGSSSEHSGCCASTDICLDSGLCMATKDEYVGTIWQKGCTDSTGKATACPDLCPTVSNSFDGLNPVSAWNIQMCDYGTYCCRAIGDHNNCCSNGTAPHVTTTFLGALQTSTATSTPSSTASSTASPSSCPKDKSAAVGGAIGGIFGAIILGLCGAIWWMWKKEKHQRKMKEHYEEQFGQNFAYRRTIVVESDSRLDLPTSIHEDVKGDES